MEQYHMDDRWKLSREDPNNHSYKSSKSSTTSLSRSISHNCSTSKSLFQSQKNTSFRSNLSRSSSTRSSPTAPSNLSRSSSQKCAKFRRKCSSLAKEQKAKFYIAKRCISMLVFWKKNGDS